MSADLLWSVVRKNSCFLVKSQGLTLTKEPNNLRNINSFKHNGYVNKKIQHISSIEDGANHDWKTRRRDSTVGVDPVASGKGVVLSLRRPKGQNKPGKSVTQTTLQGSRHTIRVIRNTLNGNRYRKDLVDDAIKRACAIVRSQNTAVVKKRRTRRKKN